MVDVRCPPCVGLVPEGVSALCARSEFVSLAKALFFNRVVPPSWNGRAFLELVLLRLLSRLLSTRSVSVNVGCCLHGISRDS
jgi:hypothetical protein